MAEAEALAQAIDASAWRERQLVLGPPVSEERDIDDELPDEHDGTLDHLQAPYVDLLGRALYWSDATGRVAGALVRQLMPLGETPAQARAYVENHSIQPSPTGEWPLSAGYPPRLDPGFILLAAEQERQSLHVDHGVHPDWLDLAQEDREPSQADWMDPAQEWATVRATLHWGCWQMGVYVISPDEQLSSQIATDALLNWVEGIAATMGADPTVQ